MKFLETAQNTELHIFWVFRKLLEAVKEVAKTFPTYNEFATVREMKYTSQHCCDKTMDGRMALDR